MNKLKLIIILSFLFSTSIFAQRLALKTNLLYDATTTPNLGLELAVSKHLTIDVSGNYNPWNFSNDRSIKHWMVQPEFRYWLIEKYNKHFVGLHGYYMDYFFRDVKLPMGMKRGMGYDGTGYGGGISYGYQLYLSPRWNMEFSAGFGYGYYEYDKYSLKEGDREYLGLYSASYWGVTKVGISIVYLLK